MFAVIYRGYVIEGKESDYRDAWRVVAKYFVEERGAIGSCLHQTADGMWVAYSRWPDQKTRDASWPGGEGASAVDCPVEIREAIATIKNCLMADRLLPEIQMAVIEDLLL